MYAPQSNQFFPVPHSKLTPCHYDVMFKEALSYGRSIGLTRVPLVDERPIEAAFLEKAIDLIHRKANLWRNGLPDYHGDQCMEVTSKLYALLNHHGIAADIVIGSVTVNGKKLYALTSEAIAQEASNPDGGVGLNLHAWLTIGGDSVIDYTLPSMLALNKMAPPHFWQVGFVERAADLYSNSIEYEPILVGSQFLGRVNTYDPHDVLEKLRSLSMEPQW